MTGANYFYHKLGKRIREEREKKKFSQEYLSLLCEVDRTYIARIEKGKANPTIKILKKISRVLRINLSNLLQGV